MPHPTPLPLRQAIRQRSEQGQDAASIARSLGLPPRTVRQLLRRVRLQGPDAVAPSYPRGGPRRGQDAQRLLDRAVGLRREHPTWGAGLIRVMLHRETPRLPLPTERTLQRQFRRAGLAPAPRGRRPAANPRRATQPHEVWQMDASEQVRLKGGARVSWLRVVDECSGAVLATAVFPPRAVEPGPADGGAG